MLPQTRRSLLAPPPPIPRPPDFCLCTIAACLTELGTPECLPPEVPGTPRPEPPKGFKLVVQTGLDVRNVNGSYSRCVRAAALETSIRPLHGLGTSCSFGESRSTRAA